MCTITSVKSEVLALLNDEEIELGLKWKHILPFYRKFLGAINGVNDLGTASYFFELFFQDVRNSAENIQTSEMNLLRERTTACYDRVMKLITPPAETKSN